MDELGLPDIDPSSLPEPDFFDAEDGPGARTSFPIPPEAPVQTSVQTLVASVQQEALKYDDEECEFDEFLIGVESLGTSAGASVKNDRSEKVDGSGVEEDSLNQSSSATKEEEVEDSGAKEDLDKQIYETETEGIESNQITHDSSSEPNTPDSRTSSTVIRLSVPAIGGRVSRTKKSPPKTRPSPLRVTRGNLNKSDSRKRKIDDSEEEDYEPDEIEAEDEEEDDKNMDDSDFKSEVTSTSTRTSLRTRNRKREEEDVSSEASSVRKRVDTTLSRGTRGRTARKVQRYAYIDDDGDEEEKGDEKRLNEISDVEDVDAEPANKRRRKQNFWNDKNDVLHYEDGKGKVITFKRLTVRILKLSSENDIAKLQQGLENSDEDDPDNPFLLEVCIDNIRSAEAAVKGGAKRIELCSSLAEGGLTPTGGFLTLVKEKFKDIPVFVMIRPRGGDPVYSPDEIELMTRDISHYKQMGADGFVFGALTKDCQVDVENCRLLKQTAFPLECTFHRAFDRVDRPMVALEAIISIGFTRILTSGQAPTAEAGITTLKRLVDAAGSRIKILAGAGVTSSNVAQIVRRTGVTEVHGSASKSVASTMCKPGPSKSGKRGGRKPAPVNMGNTDDSVIKVTSAEEVAKIVRNGRKCLRR